MSPENRSDSCTTSHHGHGSARRLLPVPSAVFTPACVRSTELPPPHVCSPGSVAVDAVPLELVCTRAGAFATHRATALYLPGFRRLVEGGRGLRPNDRAVNSRGSPVRGTLCRAVWNCRPCLRNRPELSAFLKSWEFSYHLPREPQVSSWKASGVDRWP